MTRQEFTNWVHKFGISSSVILLLLMLGYSLAISAYFAEHGLDQYILHRTGHGIGMGNHEAPWLSAGADQVLEENMVISIEPGLYIDDIGGFRHSDTVLVTKDGYEILTKFPSDLESLIIRKHNIKAAMMGKVIRKAINYPEPE